MDPLLIEKVLLPQLILPALLYEYVGDAASLHVYSFYSAIVEKFGREISSKIR